MRILISNIHEKINKVIKLHLLHSIKRRHKRQDKFLYNETCHTMQIYYTNHFRFNPDIKRSYAHILITVINMLL
jgi:hypothetical protein